MINIIIIIINKNNIINIMNYNMIYIMMNRIMKILMIGGICILSVVVVIEIFFNRLLIGR